MKILVIIKRPRKSSHWYRKKSICSIADGVGGVGEVGFGTNIVCVMARDEDVDFEVDELDRLTLQRRLRGLEDDLSRDLLQIRLANIV